MELIYRYRSDIPPHVVDWLIQNQVQRDIRYQCWLESYDWDSLEWLGV